MSWKTNNICKIEEEFKYKNINMQPVQPKVDFLIRNTNK